MNTTSTRQYFIDLIEGFEPELTFRGTSLKDFRHWRKQFKAKFQECLGPFPEKVPLRARVEWSLEEEGIKKTKIYLHTSRLTHVPAIVLRPKKEPRAALVAIHGHGPHGKDPVAGANYPEADEQRQSFNYGYGIELARQGYLVICPDMRPFGERSDTMPGERPIEGRDPCNVHAIKGWLLGFNLFTYNLWDLSRCVDYLIQTEKADPSRLGCFGLSGGGTSAMYFSAMDERVGATAIICALNSYRHYGIGIDNFCGTQFLPGIFRYGDHAELCGLHAPRPLHFEIGGFDYGFPVSASMEALRRVQAIYAAAGAKEAVSSHIGYGGHRYYGSATPFFNRIFT
jgi:dienelactone hydrolase